MNILITGMSGSGTSSVLEGLGRRGWYEVDIDYGAWKIPGADGELIWNEALMNRLLSNASANRHLAVDGCVPNQGRFPGRTARGHPHTSVTPSSGGRFSWENSFDLYETGHEGRFYGLHTRSLTPNAPVENAPPGPGGDDQMRATR